MNPFSHVQVERRRYELQCAFDWGDLWPAVVGMLDAVMPYHSCSLLSGIQNFRAAETRHHIVAGDYFNFNSAGWVAVSGPFLETHPRIKLYTYSDVRQTDPAAPLRRLQKEVSLSAWDQFVHLVFWHEDKLDALFSVRRTRAQGDFSPEEKDFLTALHFDLSAALHRIRQRQRERQQESVLRQYVSKLPLAVFFLDDSCRLTFATEEAYRQCAVWNLGHERARQFNPRDCFRVPTDIVRACIQLVDCPSNNPTGRSDVQVEHGSICDLSATVSMHVARRPSPDRNFTVTFCTGDPLKPAPAAALQTLSRLTPSERQVALLVAGGKRNQEIAQELSKSLRTVEFQLNVIYRKLGIGSRTQLTGILISSDY